MANKYKIIGIIPARGGSKGIPGKNIRLLAGKPLIHYSVISALESRVFDRIILSTDSAKIADSVKMFPIEVPFLRPADMASDTTPMFSVVKHALESVEKDGWSADIAVLLQPTAPLRKAEHIRTAVKMLVNLKCDSVVSVVEVPMHFSPDYVMRIDGGRLTPFLPGGALIQRRQDARQAYSRDGTIYALWRSTLRNHDNLYGKDCRPLVIPPEYSCNLDTLEDWKEIEKRISA